MHPRPQFLIASALGAAVFLSSISSAQAWDQHHFLTEKTLLGFERRDPALWMALNTPLVVTPIENFARKAFGPDCTWPKLRDHVMEGLGRNYSVQYTPTAESTLQINWATGNSLAQYKFASESTGANPQAPGQSVLPREVVAIYSDEPDWGMDDDVPRLKDQGIAQGIEGMGTRTLRHFWFEGESEFDVDLGRGQELDRRIQLFYNLSQVAFSVGEPYWGYRFLGNALHYLQDLTQPFHVKAVISSNMIYPLDFAHALLCAFITRSGSSVRSGSEATCHPEDTILNATIKSGWLTGTYHSIYEDFGRSLLTSDAHQSADFVIDPTGYLERTEPAEKLSIAKDANGFLVLKPLVQQIQQVIRPEAGDLASLLYSLFGNRYRYHPDEARQEILLEGSSQSVGSRMATADFYSMPLTPGQQELKRKLLAATHRDFQRAGTWGRELLRRSMATSDIAPTQLLRLEMTARCALK
jgi:hypothetical protein